MDFANLVKVLVIGCYLAGTVASMTGMLCRRKGLLSAGMGLAVAGFLFHTIDLGITTSQPGNSLLEGRFYFSLLAWALLLAWFVAWKVLKLGFLSATMAPLALLFYLPSMAAPHLAVNLPKQYATLFFALHIGALYASIALLAIASGAGVGFLHLERRIKSKEKLTGFRLDLPSLSAFDRANHLAVVVGFPLYTLGVAAGFVWAGIAWGSVFSWDPKEITAVALWIAFAYLFHQRVMLGRMGRKAAVMAIWIFCLSVGSMVLINTLLPTHHGFQRPPL